MSMDVGAQYDKLYRYCYFKLHNRDLAEDVTQEAFLRYFESYRHLREGQELSLAKPRKSSSLQPVPCTLVIDIP